MIIVSMSIVSNDDSIVDHELCPKFFTDKSPKSKNLAGARSGGVRKEKAFEKPIFRQPT
jgi:hypothetical protein